MTTAAQRQPVADLKELQPYIFFYGRCEEALEFYKGVFGGTYELSRNADTPMGKDLPPEAHQRVMHATFEGPGFTFMASDGRETKSVDPDAGNISLSLSMKTRAEGERIFTELGAGGTVVVPMDEAFWGGRFGIVHDRFGAEWMITSP